MAQFPELIFKATRVEAAKPGGELKLVGELTIKGITREVELEVEQLGELKDPWGNQRAAFSAKTAIDRKDFGLTWNQVLETGGLAVGERVNIEIELQAVVRPARRSPDDGRAFTAPGRPRSGPALSSGRTQDRFAATTGSTRSAADRR